MTNKGGGGENQPLGTEPGDFLLYYFTFMSKKDKNPNMTSPSYTDGKYLSIT